MCGLFLFTLVCGRHERKRGWEISNFFGIFGKFEFFGFQKGCRCELIYIKIKYILKNVYYNL